jgi:hypothetical protein
MAKPTMVKLTIVLNFFFFISKDKQEKKSGDFFSSSLLCGLRQAREGGVKRIILMFVIFWPIL